MKYGINQWLYKAIEGADVIRLTEFTKRLAPELSLTEVLDRKSVRLLSGLTREKLELLECSFPGIIKMIPFEEALISGNTFLLEYNRECYFRDGWENTVRNIFFLNYARSTNIAAFLRQDELKKWIDTLSWIRQEQGFLSQIADIKSLCSLIELQLRNRLQKDFSEEEKKEWLAEIKRLREITGEHSFCFEDYTYNSQEVLLDFAGYESVDLNMRCVVEQLHGFDFFGLVSQCGLDKLELEEADVLTSESTIQRLLKQTAYNEPFQKILVALYTKYGCLEELCRVAGVENKYGTYRFILEVYYSGEPDQKIPAE